MRRIALCANSARPAARFRKPKYQPRRKRALTTDRGPNA